MGQAHGLFGVPAGDAYADPAFAASHAEHGEVLRLEHCGGSVLLTPIPGTDRVDARGPYPLLACRHPHRLVDDLEQMRDAGAVTFTAVLDPLRGAVDPDRRLAILRPFKTHYLTVPSEPRHTPSRHHLKEIRSTLGRLEVVNEPGHQAEVTRWLRLWIPHVQRHKLTGMSAASLRTFSRQFALDGAVVMWALVGGAPVAAQLLLTTSDAVYAHLGMSDAIGRERRALYALDAELHTLAQEQGSVVHWGGSVGATDAVDGVAAYKRGWANAERAATLVGAVLDEAAYRALGGRQPVEPAEWFPPYRAPKNANMGSMP